MGSTSPAPLTHTVDRPALDRSGSPTHFRLTAITTAFLVAKALLFVFLIPPWQIPDEPSHVEYALHLGQTTPQLQSKIAKSLMQFETRRYAESEVTNLSYGFVSIINDYPPLYYYLISRWLPASSLLEKLYLLRLLSSVFQVLFAIGCIWLVRNLLKEYPRHFACDLPLMVATTALLIPQTCLIFAGVTSDVLACVTFTLILALLTSLLRASGHGSVRSRIGVVWKLVCLAVMVTVAFLSKATALLVFPVTVLALALVACRFRTLRDVVTYLGTVAFIAILLLFAVPGLGLHYDLIPLAQRAGGVLDRLLHPLSSLPEISVGLAGRFIAILFVSFWYSYGWMVYKMGPAWYGMFFMTVLVGGAGWMFVRRQSHVVWGSVVLCVVGLCLSVAVVFVERGPQAQEMLTQARFIFPNIASIAALIGIGWQGLFAAAPVSSFVSKFRSTAGRSSHVGVYLLVIFLLFTNVIVVFKYIIPTFYLN